MKKAAMRWSVYRLPVRYRLTDSEERLLKKLPNWATLIKTEKCDVKEALFSAYNAEQRHWGLQTISQAGATDTVSTQRQET